MLRALLMIIEIILGYKKKGVVKMRYKPDYPNIFYGKNSIAYWKQDEKGFVAMFFKGKKSTCEWG